MIIYEVYYNPEYSQGKTVCYFDSAIEAKKCVIAESSITPDFRGYKTYLSIYNYIVYKHKLGQKGKLEFTTLEIREWAE